jgi:alpha-tubulin suppressor-like RCC1 family protein
MNNDTTTTALTPENPVTSVAAGYRHTVTLLADGSVACWGYND